MDRTRPEATHDVQLASYLVALRGYTLRGIEGEAGRKSFVLDRPIDAAVVADFYRSDEKRLLDTFRSLKIALLTG